MHGTGSDLARHYRRFLSLKRTVARLAPDGTPFAGQWPAWNAAVEQIQTLVDEIAAVRATDLDDLVIKLSVLIWWCTSFDVFADAEGPSKLEAFARDLRRYRRDRCGTR
ncbi:MAG TPA: hypothetical protein VG757_04950 [Devosia sp.]|nr:hypothetical protein [Devosia sp.]